MNRWTTQAALQSELQAATQALAQARVRAGYIARAKVDRPLLPPVKIFTQV